MDEETEEQSPLQTTQQGIVGHSKAKTRQGGGDIYNQMRTKSLNM